ncbi:MAG: phosphatidylserine/phosphatidylglycerophosphate/cardiolipin synthase family protein [Sphingomonadaceae bacterium]|nr:phosphatidylserine/phosphatidylglycerophosphate/cardiolipin synthase family protein [Sphingomonadaceae bacterium]MCP5392130.1 phosphatidylserine/phosphatidylglycerophosphate/cardiolipin synthase family protein [Sphingomonadaceae bacterium]
MVAEPEPSEHEYPRPFRIEAQGHEFEFLPDGVHRFDALLALIARAERSIEMFYYMFQDDPAGRIVRDELAKAQRRGVAVHLIVDSFGTDAGQEFFQPIVDAGGEFAFFNPRWNVRYLIRNHQKITIADGTTAMLGGFNVSEHYFKPPEENGWADLGVLVRGPVIADICKWFAKLARWTGNPRRQYRSIRTMVRDWRPGKGPVRFLVGGPTRIPSSWNINVKRDFARASRLDMVMAYFSPPRSYRRQIRKIAKAGGDVRLVMAGKSDNGATIGAARATYGASLRAGVRVYEFQPCKLHMKLIVVDDVVYFGSANFDHRSVRINMELMVRVESAEMAAKVRAMIDTMVADSVEVTRRSHRRDGGFFRRFKWYLSWFLVSSVDYTVSRRLNAGL